MSNNVSECRICFESETEDNPFIQPCACKGTSQYIHLTCLEKWRREAENRVARNKCMECGERYIIAKEYPLEIYPFSNTLMMTNYISKCLLNNLFGCGISSVILYWIDAKSQISLIVFSFGNNWYRKRALYSNFGGVKSTQKLLTGNPGQ